MTIFYDEEEDASFLEEYQSIANAVIATTIAFVRCPYEVHVDVSLVDNGRIREANLDFRGVDRPTDVLSFPMVDYEAPADFSLCEQYPERYFDAETGELQLGDIMLSTEKVFEQAESYGHSARREFAFLIAHSMLHLFGYDHENEIERIQMEDMQDDILNRLDYTRSMDEA